MNLRTISFAIACALISPGCDFLTGLEDFVQRVPLYFNSFESSQEMCLRLKCWGKRLHVGGGVSLFIKGELPRKGIFITWR